MIFTPVVEFVLSLPWHVWLALFFMLVAVILLWTAYALNNDAVDTLTSASLRLASSNLARDRVERIQGEIHKSIAEAEEKWRRVGAEFERNQRLLDTIEAEKEELRRLKEWITQNTHKRPSPTAAAANGPEPTLYGSTPHA